MLLTLTFGVFPSAIRTPTALTSDQSALRLPSRFFRISRVHASQESSGPSTTSVDSSDTVLGLACASLRTHTSLPSGFATPSGFRTPSTPSSEIYLPALFHAGAIHGLPCLRRFLPIRSPDDLSAPGVLHAVTFGTRSCSHLAARTFAASAGPASRMSASDGCVAVASRV